MPEFTWTPDFGAAKELRPRITTTKFGDGYENRVAVGLNTNPQTWMLTFSNRTVAEIDEIDDFLEARGGSESFDWTPPRADDAIKVKCEQWQRSLQSSAFDTLTANFEEVFET